MSRERPNQTSPDLTQSSNVGNFDQEVRLSSCCVSALSLARPCQPVHRHMLARPFRLTNYTLINPDGQRSHLLVTGSETHINLLLCDWTRST